VVEPSLLLIVGATQLIIALSGGWTAGVLGAATGLLISMAATWPTAMLMRHPPGPDERDPGDAGRSAGDREP
jgi:hypothetical protein